MSGALYEQYKEALRRGHVAALRGRLEEALAAYAEAASIATERPLPHSSLGTVYLRLGRVDEAIASFDAALQRVPKDEAALLGRADALERADRRAEAAETLDLVVAVREAAGRPLEALESARRAAEIAGSRRRRRVVARLAAGPGPATAATPAQKRPSRRRRTRTPTGGPGPERQAEPEPVPEPAPETEPAPEPAPRPDAAVLVGVADRALAAGDAAAARRALLAAAAAYSAAGLRDAALDACHRALELAPGDPDVHLALVDLYVARGWRALAAEKLSLLERLVTLDRDDEALSRVRSRVGAAEPDGRPAPPTAG